jgi:glycine/D-amino acid oxidase-like deaminating enzyme
VTRPTVYDCVVIGGGIAGLALAEIYARSGRSVALIERNHCLCQEASGSHHGWFHFGSLYSIFPQSQFLRTMVGGVEDLLAYYGGFPGMNIEVTKGGKLAFPQSANAWLRDEPIEYIVSARNDPDFDMRAFEGVRSYAKKAFFLLTWEMAIKQFISRHQRFHKHDWSGSALASQWVPRAGVADYSRDVIGKPGHDLGLDRDTHFQIVGYDRPMRSVVIVADLARGLIGAGGEVRTGVEVERLERDGGLTRVHTSAGTFVGRKVIASAGKWLGHFMRRSTDVKVVASPLLVAHPAVASTHLVRMTPFVERSINHLHHLAADNIDFSLIGGGYFADPDDSAAVKHASERLVEMAHGVFPKLAQAKVKETYLGYKTEIVADRGERNYQYFLREVDEGVHVAVPGKFSLAFSLAVNTFKRLEGAEPERSVKLAPAEAVTGIVGPTRPAALILQALGRLKTSASAASTPARQTQIT